MFLQMSKKAVSQGPFKATTLIFPFFFVTTAVFNATLGLTEHKLEPLGLKVNANRSVLLGVFPC